MKVCPQTGREPWEKAAKPLPDHKKQKGNAEQNTAHTSWKQSQKALRQGSESWLFPEVGPALPV
jgi:hypothetical protein